MLDAHHYVLETKTWHLHLLNNVKKAQTWSLACHVVVFRVGVAAPGLQIDLQRHSLGVGEIFLHGWNDLETAVPHAVGRFSSFSIIFVEKWQKRTIFIMTRPSRFEFKIQIAQNTDHE